MKPGLERISVACVATASLAMVMAHGVSALAAGVVAPPESSTALPLTLTIAAVVLACAVSWGVLPHSAKSTATGIGLSGCAAAALAGTQGGFGPGAIAILLVGSSASYAGRRLAERLPDWLDGSLRRRPGVCVLWGVLALATVVQTARLSTYMSDPSFNWVPTTSDAFWARHECMVAYMYAAELNRRGEENVYHTDHYPGSNPKAEPRTELAGMTPDDPYQYPPQFLLLPRTAIALTSDFQTIRTVWFMIQIAAFVTIAVLLAGWIGGRHGDAAMLLIPAACISIPAMYNFQYGQFHLASIMLAVAAMLAFESRRNGVGGALLAAAMLSKIFPGLLLIPLALQRRWKALGWTAAFGIGFTLLAWAVVGTAPFAAFFEYQVPRLRSGEAFALEQAWPELKGLLLLINLAPAAVVRKLGEIGIPGMTDSLAHIAQSGYILLVLVAALLAARCRGDRRRLAITWLALLNLAVLASGGAWADYVPASSVWLITLLAGSVHGKRGPTVALILVGAVMFFLPGAVPYGTPSAAPPWMMISVGCTLALIGLNGWAVLHFSAPTRFATAR